MRGESRPEKSLVLTLQFVFTSKARDELGERANSCVREWLALCVCLCFYAVRDPRMQRRENVRVSVCVCACVCVCVLSVVASAG